MKRIAALPVLALALLLGAPPCALARDHAPPPSATASPLLAAYRAPWRLLRAPLPDVEPVAIDATSRRPLRLRDALRLPPRLLDAIVQPIADRTGTTIMTGMSMSLGMPGLFSTSIGRDLRWVPGGERHQHFTNAGLGTLVAFGNFTFEARKAELGLSLPFISYSKGHPVYGDRICVFVPMVGWFQVTSEGGIGGGFTFLRDPLTLGLSGGLNASASIFNPALRRFTRPAFRKMDRGIVAARGWVAWARGVRGRLRGERARVEASSRGERGSSPGLVAALERATTTERAAER